MKEAGKILHALRGKDKHQTENMIISEATQAIISTLKTEDARNKFYLQLGSGRKYTRGSGTLPPSYEQSYNFFQEIIDSLPERADDLQKKTISYQSDNS